MSFDLEEAIAEYLKTFRRIKENNIACFDAAKAVWIRTKSTLEKHGIRIVESANQISVIDKSGMLEYRKWDFRIEANGDLYLGKTLRVGSEIVSDTNALLDEIATQIAKAALNEESRATR